MANVLPDEVRELFGNDADNISDTIIENIISDAYVLVTSVLADCTILTEDELKSIEKWLAAHMMASSVIRQTKEETLGEASVKYTGEWGTKLESTSYGQMVLALDRCGKMANLGRKAAKIRAITSFE
jgi:hypothetical protein